MCVFSLETSELWEVSFNSDSLSGKYRIAPFVVNWGADTELVLTIILSTSVVVVTLCRNNTSFTSLEVRADSQPFSFVRCGQSFKVLVEESFIFSTRSNRVFTSVRSQVITWDTDIQGTQRVIDTTRKVFTESVILHTDILGTWVLVVTIFVGDTDWFAVAFLQSVCFSACSAVSPFSLFAFAVGISVAFVIATFLQSVFNTANSSVCRLRAVRG